MEPRTKQYGTRECLWRSVIIVYGCYQFWLQCDPARHGTARRSPTGNRSWFCEANNFFVSAPNQLKLRIWIDQRFLKKNGVKFPKTAANHVFYIPFIHVNYIDNPSQFYLYPTWFLTIFQVSVLYIVNLYKSFHVLCFL